MNCPLCYEPLLFGATNCPCGYNLATTVSEQLPIELTYREALRAFWRVYWPTQIVEGMLIAGLGAYRSLLRPLGYTLLGLPSVLLIFALNAAVFDLFVPRLCSRPYKHFSLVVVKVATGETTSRLRGSAHQQVWFFLWWRQLLASGIAAVLMMPLNALLSLVGLYLSQQIAVLAGVLAIGPILLKMLIGHQFPGIRIEARRR